MSHDSAVESLLFAALEKAAGAERNAFLDAACGGDAELRRLVERLLRAEARAGAFLQKPVLDQLAGPGPSHESNRTTDLHPALGSTREPGAAADAPDGGLPALPGYRVLREIARGGMGRVLAARDLTLDRDVALKVLLPGANPDRFVRESRISARLAHPGIPPVHALGTMADGSPFLAMKLVAGQTLAVEIKTADRPRLLQAFTQVCQAVGFAHSKGVVHRDLKPANVMVGAFGEVQVMDWGLAKDLTGPDDGDEPGSPAAQTTDSHAAGSTDVRTRTGTVLGTPGYMAPEQARGEACGVRSDVFALGGILCAILTGQAPYGGKSTAELIQRAAAADLAEAFARLDGSGADAELLAVCRRCLSADPADRPADGQAVAAELTAYLDGVQERLQTVLREQAVAVTREAEQRKRRKVQRALAAAVVALLLGGGAFALWRNAQVQAGRDRDTRTDEAVATHLQQGKEAMQANDVARAQVALEAARKRFAEGGAGHHEKHLAGLESDLAVLIGLDEFEQFRWTVGASDFPEKAEQVARLRKALGQFQLNPESSPEEASALVKGSAVRDRLVAALDYWMILEPLPWVCAVLQGADPHPYRDAVRAALLAKNEEALKELASQQQAAEQPPGFVVALAELENATLPAKRRREMLEVTLREHPQNLAMLMAMGTSYRPEKKGSAAEKVRWFQAAVAVAPGNGAAHYYLGYALVDKGELVGAIACFRKAALLAPETVAAYFYRTKEPTYEGDPGRPTAGYPKTAVLDPPTDARAYLILGIVLRNEGDLDKAIVAYRKAIELEPGYARAYRGLGVALNETRDPDGAIDNYRKAIELEPTYAPAYNSLGIALKARGDLNGAVAQYRKAIELDPESAHVRYNLGNALAARGDMNGAAVQYRKAVELNPANVKAQLNLANALKARGDLDGAVDSYRKLIARAPNSAVLYFNLGTTLHHKGDLNGAIDNYRKAIELDPEDAEAHYGLGNSLYARRDWDGAIENYRKAIELEPTFAAAYHAMGNALYAKRDWDGAIDSYRKVIELDPKDATAYFGLGNALMAGGDLEGAVVQYRKAIAIKPDYAAAHYGLGNAFGLQGDPDGAIDALRTAIRLDPKYVLAYTTLGHALKEKGDPDGAISYLNEAIRLDPKSARAHFLLGFALKAKGDLDGAIDKINKAVELAPNDALVHNHLGFVLMVKGDLNGAIDQFNTAIKLDPKYAKARDNLVRAERIAPVQGKFPALLKGDYRPQANDERLGLADLCALRGHNHASAGLFADAFAADSKVAADLKAGHRYYGVCSSVLAAAGKGEDAASLDDRERTRLRQQALDWLRADLVLRTRQLASGQPADRADVRQNLRYWQTDRDLAGVRDADALAKLPAEERAAWEKLWADVAELLKKAEAPAPR